MMELTMELIVALFVILVFDIVALHWGFESGDGWSSSEWERRRNWRGFH